jgi:hypothetical protein
MLNIDAIPFLIFLMHSWLNPLMWNYQIQRANCTFKTENTKLRNVRVVKKKSTSKEQVTNWGVGEKERVIHIMKSQFPSYLKKKFLQTIVKKDDSSIQKMGKAGCQWLTPVILATLKAEM